MPRVAVPFNGVPDGEVAVRHFAIGDEVEGDLAKVAEAEGWLEPASPAASLEARAGGLLTAIRDRGVKLHRRLTKRMRGNVA
jgi:hypothetical protein